MGPFNAIGIISRGLPWAHSMQSTLFPIINQGAYSTSSAVFLMANNWPIHVLRRFLNRILDGPLHVLRQYLNGPIHALR
jgi:hypothetical protein